MVLKRRHLLGIQDLKVEEMELILYQAKAFKEITQRRIKKVPTLRGQTVVNLFYEPSTRTRTSFELAAKWLSADVVNISTSTSSVVKGESLRDMAKTIEAMQADTIILRHGQSGAPHLLSNLVSSSIVNAGDGSHEHPTQSLLDIFTLLEHRPTLNGLVVGIVGDILHSRVARSNIWGLTKMGAKVVVVGPPTLIPVEIERIPVEVAYDLDKTIERFDVLMILRIQLERQQSNFFPSINEYVKFYGLNNERLKRAKEDVLIMHPGPINRGIEIAPEVADGPHSVITDQVTNGIAVRMAVLYLLATGWGEG
ncbi:TPA: aspartate carbamoyltransferase [bacterium]|nr:aspartate carbamoyltransferase [bacterium]